jgi:glutamyl-tRNA reductase
MDDLSEEADSNRAQRETEIAAVEKMIEKEVDLVAKWWQVYTVRPAIKALISKAEKIRAGQFDKTLKKLSSLTEEDRQAIEMLTSSIVDKILHDPISYLKSSDNGHSAERSQLVKRLFKLEDLKE